MIDSVPKLQMQLIKLMPDVIHVFLKVLICSLLRAAYRTLSFKIKFV